MSKTIQICVDDVLKKTADELFLSLGLDTSTAIRIFLTMAVETGGIPFDVKIPNTSLKQSMLDVINRKNLSPRYKTAEEAINAMLED